MTGARPTPPRDRLAAEVPRLLVLAVAGALCLPGFAPLFTDQRYLLTGGTALVTGALTALLLHRRRWGPLRGTLLLLAATALLGSALITPLEARWGWLPTRESLRVLASAPVTAWMRVLTAAAPLDAGDGVLMVLWVPVLLAGTLGGALILQGRVLPALLAPVTMLATSILLGTGQEVAPIPRGVGIGLCCLLATQLTRGDPACATSPSLPPRGSLLRAGVVLGTVGGAAALLAPWKSAAAPRSAPRDHLLPSWDPWTVPSPLSTLRGHRTRRATRPLLAVDGVRGGDRLRLAVMDRHDGHALLAAGGGDRPRRDATDTGAFHRRGWGTVLMRPVHPTRTVTVTVLDLRGPWLPLPAGRPGRLERLDRPGTLPRGEQPVFNPRSRSLALPTGLRGGERYRVAVDPEPTSPAQLGPLRPAADRLPPAPPLPRGWGALVPDPGIARADALATVHGLAADLTAARRPGPRDPGSAGMPGHGLARLLAMTAGSVLDPARGSGPPRPLDGDEEQLTVLLTLLARSAGIPARVVLGFVVPPEPPSTLTLTGRDVTAWVELRLDGAGWVPVDLPRVEGTGEGS